MMLSVVVRKNAVDPAIPNPGQYLKFDNMNEVRFGNPAIVEKAEFSKLEKAVREKAKKNPDTVHVMLAQPSFAEDDKDFHYNFITWRDRITGKSNELWFDTMAFLTNDEGKTLDKIKG